MSTGAKVGIGVGASVAGLGILGTSAFVVYKRFHASHSPTQPMTDVRVDTMERLRQGQGP